jgi:hypothetical protein
MTGGASIGMIHGVVSRGLAMLLAGLALTASGAASPGPDEKADLEARRQAAQRRFEALRAQYEDLRRVEAAMAPRIDTLKRRLPPSFDATQEQASIRALALGTGLDLTIALRPGGGPALGEDGRPAPLVAHKLDISGQVDYAGGLSFLLRLAQLPRMVAIESLHLQAAPLGMVRLQGTLTLPTLAELDSPSAGTTLEARMEEALERRRRDHALVDAMAAIVDSHRVLDAVQIATRKIGDHAVVFTGLRHSRDTVLEGLALGAAARAALKPALEEAGLAVTDVRWAQAGHCRSFSVTARTKEDAPRAGPVNLDSLFEHRGPAACRLDPQAPARAVSARGASPDGLTVRLRGADAGDALRVLHDLTSQAFVVDGAVKGAVDMDLEGTTLEESLAALVSAGVAAVGPGPVRVVSPAATGALPSVARAEGEARDPVSLSFKDGELCDILRLFEEVSGYQLWTPRDLNGRVDVFLSEVPWDQALDAILLPSGMMSRVEGDRLMVVPRPGSPDRAWGPAVKGYGVPTKDTVPYTRLRVPRIEGVGREDLELVGVGRTGNAWKAYAYGPRKLLWVLAGGERLFGGRVSSVGRDGMTIHTSARGAVVLTLRP